MGPLVETLPSVEGSLLFSLPLLLEQALLGPTVETSPASLAKLKIGYDIVPEPSMFFYTLSNYVMSYL